MFLHVRGHFLTKNCTTTINDGKCFKRMLPEVWMWLRWRGFQQCKHLKGIMWLHFWWCHGFVLWQNKKRCLLQRWSIVAMLKQWHGHNEMVERTKARKRRESGKKLVRNIVECHCQLLECCMWNEEEVVLHKWRMKGMRCTFAFAFAFARICKKGVNLLFPSLIWVAFFWDWQTFLEDCWLLWRNVVQL